MAEEDSVRAGHPGEGDAEEFGERLVPLVRDHTADVVRLHDLRQVGHSQPLLEVLLEVSTDKIHGRCPRISKPTLRAWVAPVRAVARGARHSDYGSIQPSRNDD